jgi:hypothetical protein
LAHTRFESFSGYPDDFCGQEVTHGIYYDDEGLVPALTIREPNTWGNAGEMWTEALILGALDAARVLATIMSTTPEVVPEAEYPRALAAVRRIARVRVVDSDAMDVESIASGEDA